MTITRRADGIYRPIDVPLEPPASGTNLCAHDRCARCQQRKAGLMAVETPGKYGPRVEMVCISCVGKLRGKAGCQQMVGAGRGKRPAPEPTTAGPRLLYAGQPIPTGEYTVTEIVRICGRVRVTVHAEILKLGLGRLRQSMFREPGQNHEAAGIGPRYRILDAGEVEKLRTHFQQRQRGRKKVVNKPNKLHTEEGK